MKTDNAQVINPFVADGETFVKNEIVPLTDYMLQLPQPPIYAETLIQAATDEKGQKRVELKVADVVLVP